MKLYILLFSYLCCQFLGATCSSVNIYQELGEFQLHMSPRMQNYGTCYAEAASYSYNIAVNSCEKKIHPLHYIFFAGNQRDKLSVNGGFTSQFLAPSKNVEICSYDGVEYTLSKYSNLIQQAFKLHLSPLESEADLIAILQAAMLLKNVNLNSPISFKYLILKYNQLVRADEIYLKYSFPKGIFNNPEAGSEKSLFANILEMHYKKNIAEDFLTNKQFKDFDSQVEKSLMQVKKNNLKQLIFNFFNNICVPGEKFHVAASKLNDELLVINQKDNQKTLERIIKNLENKKPVRLSIDAVALDPNSKGAHAVVIMGSRPTRGGACEVLIRNSWGELYPNSISCTCYDHTYKEFKSCSPAVDDDKNIEVLACWYSWNGLTPYIYGYQPVP